jgi:hypothetical protein
MPSGPETVDPAAARRALALAATQRRHVVAATREPWWTWLLVFVLTGGLWASLDLGPAVQTPVLYSVLALVLGLSLLPRLSPRIASLLGRPAVGHRTLIPVSARLAMFGASLALYGATMWYGRRLLELVGAPAWAVDHPHVTASVPLAVAVTAIGWAVDRRARALASRERRERPQPTGQRPPATQAPQ